MPEPLYAGSAGGSGLQMEYNRAYEDNPGKFGTCKVPVVGCHSDYSADVEPLDPDDSYLLFRMSTNDERLRMPVLGRSTVHAEGVALTRSGLANWMQRVAHQTLDEYYCHIRAKIRVALVAL